MTADEGFTRKLSRCRPDTDLPGRYIPRPSPGTGEQNVYLSRSYCLCSHGQGPGMPGRAGHRLSETLLHRKFAQTGPKSFRSVFAPHARAVRALPGKHLRKSDWCAI